MILVTVGTNRAPYEGLFEAMDEYALKTGEEVLIQRSMSDFRAKHCRDFGFVSDEEMRELYDRTDILVCHAGIGTIVNGLERNIPLVLVPREVVTSAGADDQQTVVARKVAQMGRGVVVEDLNDLYAKIDEARSLKMEPYVKDTGLLDYIDRRLTELSEGRRKR